MGAPPQVTQRIIEALLDTHAKAARERRLMLVHGRYAPGAPTEFTAKTGDRRKVKVSDQTSVLGIVDQWQRHPDETADTGTMLVITTDVDETQLGWDLRGHAVRRGVLPVESAEIVKQRFGAADLDPRIYRAPWLLQALLDAEPHGGWPRTGTVLTFDTAMHALAVARLGLGEAHTEAAVDADTLLAWSRTPAGPARFAQLGEAERREMKTWLGESAGGAVGVLLSLAEAGRGGDAMALGLLGSVLADPAAPADAVLAVGGLFGQAAPRGGDVKTYTEAVEGTLTRWIVQAETDDLVRQDVHAVLHRADTLAATAELTGLLHRNRFLPVGFDAQLRSVAAALPTSPDEAETALADLRGHALARLSGERVAAAEMAVRTARWLTTEQLSVASVGAGVRTHLAEWGWVDRALTVLWAGDQAGDPAVSRAYRTLYEAARARRDALDEEFARRLAAWTRTADATHPGGALPVENVLREAAVPLLGGHAPLILLLDGMSSAVAVQFGEELERLGWHETVPRPAEGKPPQRLAAVSMLPSVTRISRASLLTGKATAGGQSVEAGGFAEFWQKRHKPGGVLFHKAAISGGAGQRLSEELVDALASQAVVGVVLNTIDDALDHGQQGDRIQWRLPDVSFLRELLDAARGYERPVLLVADHGHVLERGGAQDGPAYVSGAESARWRTGTAGDGEVELSGPRVLEGGGTIVAPWREDVRYTPRKAGYHGGAALAEVTVPLLVLAVSRETMPKGWQPLPRENAVPSWWRKAAAAQPAPAVIAAAPVAKSGRKRTAHAPAGEGLFAAAEVTPVPSDETAAEPLTLGARVVGSEVYEAQKAYVRKAPDAKVVAVIDALAAAGGTLSPAAVAAAAASTGRAPRNTDGFVRTLQRLLNVEGYPVLGFVDSGHTVKLDVSLLRAQFHLPQEATP